MHQCNRFQAESRCYLLKFFSIYILRKLTPVEVKLMDYRFNKLILDLYSHAQTEPISDFSNFAMTEMKGAIEFDSAGSVLFHAENTGKVLITGVLAFNVMPDKVRIRKEYLEEETYDPNRGFISRDTLLTKCINKLNSADSLHADDAPDKDLREYAHRTNSANSLTYVTRESNNTYKTFSLWRAHKKSVFDKSDLNVVNLMAPHIFQALTINRKLSVNLLLSKEKTSGFLISEKNGSIHYISDDAIFLLRREYPSWLSHQLPNEVVSGFQSSESKTYIGSQIIMNLKMQGSLMMISIQPRSPGSKLTTAELRVVEKVVQYATYKEAARQLGVSPATIRNQLHAIYKKLGIKGKSELAKVID